jgi:DNA-binding NarL/FixJ family response regulator
MPPARRGCDAEPVALRCVIVDDHREFLEAASDLLRRERLDIVGVASTAAEAVQLTGELQPDVVLVDIYLGRENGFALARRLASSGADGSRPAVIVISTYAEKDLAEVIAASAAAGFVSKSELSAAAIHAVLGRSELS